MRGKRTSISKMQVDLVIVSVRYQPGSTKLEFARGYARRGQVWTDIQLFDRKSLVEALKQGQDIVTGESLPLVGDFVLNSSVRLGPEDQLMVGKSSEADGDSLGLPVL
jgi:hypothetical protein